MSHKHYLSVPAVAVETTIPRPWIPLTATHGDARCAWLHSCSMSAALSRGIWSIRERTSASSCGRVSIVTTGIRTSRIRRRQPGKALPSPLSSSTTMCSTTEASGSSEFPLDEDIRSALSKGDLSKALALLGQHNSVGKAESQGHAFPLVTGTHHNRHEGDVQQSDRPTLELGKETEGVVVVESSHAPLVTLLWKLGHEHEALTVFDIVRERARVDAEYAVAVQGSRLRWKPQMGVPGFSLNLPREICHGVMRAKLEQRDWQAVIEAMRASSRGPRRGTRRKATMGSLEAEKTAAVGSARCGGTIGSTSTTSLGDERDGWAPDEETYAIALEACGKVQKRWGFKVALFLIQEMRDAKLDISLEHYRGAILACSRTRQLAGVLPLLEEMQARGVAADVETFNAAISSCTVEQVDRALNLLRAMRAERLTPSEVTHNILLRLCGLGGCWSTGLELFAMMEDDRITPTPHHYNSLFKALENAERWKEAANLFRKMRSDGLQPSALAYSSLIGVLDKCKKRQIAVAVLEEMLAESPRDSTKEYNLLLNACAKARKWEKAQKLFEEMNAREVLRDMVTYNTVINALARCGRIEEAGVHLRAMKEQGLSPDVVTFGTLIHACAMSAKREAALALFAEMISRGMKPNLEAYKGCIVSCQKDKRYKQALEIFDVMMDGRIRPDRVVYNAVIACCAQLKLWRRGVALLDEMQAKGINPDQYSYNSGIFACVKARESTQMSLLLNRMRENGFSPDVWTYSNLIRCLGDAMRWKRAVAILNEMLVVSQDPRQKGVRPDAHCFNGAISACAKVGESDEAERLMQEMKAQGIKPDIYTYNSVMNSYAVTGDWVKALAMLEDMRGLGVKINSMTYSAAIKACDKGGQWDRAVSLLNRMRSVDGAKPNLFAYNHAMSACVRANEPDIAINLLQRMESEGLKMDRMTYGVMMFLHSRNGDWQECLRLNEQMGADGIQGDWYSYHALLVALSKGRRWACAVAMFDEMRRSSIVRPDGPSYTTMLRVCEKAGFWEQALEYLQEMPSLGVRPTLMHFKLAIRACGNTEERVTGLVQEDADVILAGAAAAVPKIFNSIRQSDISPDGECYAFAIRVFQHAGVENPEEELIYGVGSQSALKKLEEPLAGQVS